MIVSAVMNLDGNIFQADKLLRLHRGRMESDNSVYLAITRAEKHRFAPATAKAKDTHAAGAYKGLTSQVACAGLNVVESIELRVIGDVLVVSVVVIRRVIRQRMKDVRRKADETGECEGGASIRNILFGNLITSYYETCRISPIGLGAREKAVDRIGTLCLKVTLPC